MNDHNSFRATGWLSRDAEMRVSQKGTPWVVLNVDIASGEGDQRKHCWIDVKVFGEPARRFDGAKKGARLSVLGRIEMESWDDKKTGQKRYKHVVIADSCHEIAEARDEPAPAVDYGDIPF